MPTFTGIFTEIAIDSQLVIPGHKPPAECLLDTIIDFEITKTVVIDTPLVVPENPTLQLKKVLIVGVAKIIVKYVADVPDQQVHGARFEVPFNALIEWPDGPPQGTAICIEPVVEKSVIYLKDDRKISIIIIVRLDVYSND